MYLFERTLKAVENLQREVAGNDLKYLEFKEYCRIFFSSLKQYFKILQNFANQLFKLNEIYEVHRRILNCKNIRYSTSETSTVNTADSQIYNNLPRKDSLISLMNSYLDLDFIFVKNADISQDVNDDDMRLVNLGPSALFSCYKLIMTSGKHLEIFIHTYNVSLAYKIEASAKESDGLSVGIGRDRVRRQREVTNNKNVNGKSHVRGMLKGVFGFTEHQEKAPNGLGLTLSLSGNRNTAVFKKVGAKADARS